MRRRPKSRDEDLERELRAHLELEAEERRENGATPGEALYAARRALGNATCIKEEVREAWGRQWWERLVQDLRYAARTLRSTPAFTTIAVLSLALGIGATSAIFSLLNAVLLRPLPVPNPGQLVQFSYTLPAGGPDTRNNWFDYPHLERFRAESKTLSGIFGGIGLSRVSVGFEGKTDLAKCDAYTDSLFSVLGLAPEYGRLFAAGDDREGASVAVLSDSYWRRRFAADPSIVGRTVTLNRRPFTVVGITPPEFSAIYVGGARDIWIPLRALDRLQPDPERWRTPFTTWLMIAGRLRPGVSLAKAQTELDLIHHRLLAEELAVSERRGSEFVERLVRESRLLLRPAATGMSGGFREYAAPLELLLAIAGIVLLISSANVANLVLARASARRREIAMRLALGAGRARLVRQLLTESLLLASAGGALGIAIAWWGGATLVRMIAAGDSPAPLDVRPDWRVLAFTAAVAFASAILFGLAPALRGTRIDPGPALKEGSRTAPGASRTLDRILVAAQVTLSLVLVSGAGLFARTLANLRDVDVGYDRDRVLLFSADAKLAGYPPERARPLYRAILEKVAALPAVQSASASIVRPVDDQYYLTDRIVYLDGRMLDDRARIDVAWNGLAPGYFATVGTPLVAGRDFDARDTASSPRVVIVNESLARRAFPGIDPVGHRIDEWEIVGVVKDQRYAQAREQTRPVLYRPLYQLTGGLDPSTWAGAGSISFELRSRVGAGLAGEVRRAVASLDPNVPIYRVKTLAAENEDSFRSERLLAALSGCFAGLALLLACLGLYGLTAYGAARRTAEIGIRMALGARRAGIIWLVLRETGWLVLAGVAAGVPLAAWLARFAESLLFGVAPADPVVLAVSAAVLTATAALAGFIPARRASRIDPTMALRYE